ncbi:bifunctional 3-(3-hydroxy-phenyl)propionate/3-hydroxycinnamic acid hydroxylase [Mycobacterium avium subsp. hominissuis]|uniref:bifunctional 3-(3-hydroxy-phenyl)propionate/3-hydroxycinnamic acid hydroxylase n=2 Tax=Mycobacterium avium TaxID=1764 RepID=UPI0003D22F46|nr:bifunctional 3-(3-hydroxy-phenyl)propionate/3-hydroxycinnamic acid hydroxylase [Mycobacterium avium]ETA95604.1 3-(3-hydroxyphenyl)propionate hydroxylase [Mycobacterium avium 10-5581]ATO61492.1 bifunctional 3-(3-hydroxy-phenyl)propionate/3-hydroxycinnamic acid hydroxylase [Mycobacterium avium subsp. hominissuis]ATO66043.1 bifunctional 3-(3-hydroxy-phenyl)propionate/3-hydroxycinnamic acid hydroxylase [Mycobacterium avium subsp. hominissuis]ATO70626.1 bifunctional 3-(3-hydroxy-phenyl)propionate
MIAPGPRATDHDTDVLVVGAGPVGLTLANILGLQGIRTVMVEERDTLIDYPRGVGLDDEALRTFQSIGLVERVLPHTVPNQILRFMDAKRRVLAEMAPPDARFGWPKRNGFVQPLVDAELLAGLDRFAHVQVRWGSPMTGCREDADGVNVELGADGGNVGDGGGDGHPARLRARYVVGCDGGRSMTRRVMGVSFDGTTSSTRWLVVDIANDPLGHPNSEVGADPERPYASISIAHGIRRFEFMIHADESDEQAEDPEFLTRMLARMVPHPDRVDVIRRRVYTHHSRIAGEFRRGRLLLAGDAAHLMPVWQGQGYNSGIRDAANLGWKLAAVVSGRAGDKLLDTYDMERRKHARAMIDLSTMVGRVISPTNRRVAGARDLLVRSASIVPTLKRYVLEMRFKPMPRYEHGAVVHANPGRADSPVGTLFIQPRVDTRDQQDVLLDDVLGPWFAVLCWNNNPRKILGETAFANWKALGARFFALRPATQLHWTGHDDPDVVVVGDRRGDLKSWFDIHAESVLFLRPDRCIAGACIAQRAPDLSAALFDALTLTPRGGDPQSGTGSVLYVAQPAPESSGAVAGPA